MGFAKPSFGVISAVVATVTNPGEVDDPHSTEIIAPVAFTAGTTIWSSVLSMVGFQEVSCWFNPTALGGNTSVLFYAQWSDDAANVPFDADNGLQQTDYAIMASTGATAGIFAAKNYVANLTTGGGELVAGAQVPLSYPKKGGRFRFGVRGNNASGSFSVRAQRLV